MKSFLLRRLLLSAPVLLGVCTLVFSLIHLIPGDPVQVMLGEGATATDVSDLRTRLGLDRPLVNQYAQFLRHAASGDLGESLRYREPVRSLILSRYPATLVLTGASMLLACVVAFPAGLIAAVHRGTAWDRMATTLSLLGLSLPNFWVGPLLILVFSVRLDWFPVSGMEEPSAIVLPSVALGTALAAILARMIRASLLEEIASPYCVAAAARGLGKWRVVLRHSLRNAFVPVLTVLGLQLGVLLTGAVITETVFGWPGLGRLTIQAIETRDYPLVQGCILIIALTYVLVNLATDLAYAVFDPRVRHG
ncbi:MAG: glutathione ABC transporter permease GsiC [Acidobacteria bacterium]|nr:MAG: glutathione ABC transporter permease GsiC [Acidobacteriota bacterium]